jgi:uroporphyrinogen-III synthase
MNNILSTKKLDIGIIEQARSKNVNIAEVEFIKVRPIASKEKWEEVFRWIQGKEIFVVFTSRHAVEAVNQYLHPYLNPYQHQWKIFCLAGSTKQAVEKSEDLHGKIIDTAVNAADLAEKIIKWQAKEVVFFCGDQRRNELPDSLKNNGIQIHECVVYHTTETPVSISENYDGILFFSPSAARSFFSLNQPGGRTVCFAVGQTTAKTIEEFTEAEIIISNNSSQESVMESVYEYFNQKGVGRTEVTE